MAGHDNAAARRGRRSAMTPRRSATVRGALLFLVPILVLIAAIARGLPDERRGPIPDWRPDSAATRH